MSVRLQVVVSDDEMRRFRATAREFGMSVSEWVRQVLRDSEREVAEGDPASKLQAVRAAVAHDFPAPDIDQMLDEIAAGRGDTDLP